MPHQTTLTRPVTIAGKGVHGGAPCRMTLLPAEADTGIVFAPAGGGAAIRAAASSVASSELATVIGDPAGFHVSTIEHVMSALSGLEFDNVCIEIAGGEVPILDGSAAEFVAALEEGGRSLIDAPRRAIRVKSAVRVEEGAGWAEFLPHDGRRFEVGIDFATPAIGRQSIAIDLDPESYKREIAPARTFGFMRDVERLWAAGLALGSGLDNSVVIDDGDRVVNGDGLRFADEFVRHKTLDAIGDTALAGMPILGAFRSYRSGHRLNARALAALLDHEDAFEIVES